MCENQFIEEFLNFFEETEMSLLSWGFYNISYNPSEFEQLFIKNAPKKLLKNWNKYKTNNNIDFEEFLEELSEEKILYKLPNNSYRYRTRFAEGVRLLKNVKQRFSLNDWISAKNLVSDIKFNLQKRKYPKFNITTNEILDELIQNNNLNDLQKQVLLDLSKNPKGEILNYAGFQLRSFKRILNNYNSNNNLPTGTIICAGTGSGKTKSFYIPAFLGVVGEIDKSPFTKVISIYPRNVLLADQLREGISESLKIFKTLKGKNKRPVTFGALIGDTPNTKMNLIMKIVLEKVGKSMEMKVMWFLL